MNKTETTETEKQQAYRCRQDAWLRQALTVAVAQEDALCRAWNEECAAFDGSPIGAESLAHHTSLRTAWHAAQKQVEDLWRLVNIDMPSNGGAS